MDWIEAVFTAKLGRLLLVIQNELKVKQPAVGTEPPGVADVFGELQNIAVDVAKKITGTDDLPVDKPRQPALDKFIDAQRQAFTAAGLQHQKEFVDNTKPAIRALAGTPRVPGADPRVEYTSDLIDSVKSGTAQAKAEQYDASAVNWAVAEAQVTIGKHTNTDTSDVVTDLGKSDSGMGVFIIIVNAGAPTNLSPLIKEVRVEGLTEKVRKHLENSDRELKLLGPRRVIADATNPSTEVIASRNEENELFVNSTDKDALNWLSKHGDASTPGLTTPAGGANALIDEIEQGPQNTLKKAGGLKL